MSDLFKEVVLPNQTVLKVINVMTEMVETVGDAVTATFAIMEVSKISIQVTKHSP